MSDVEPSPEDPRAPGPSLWPVGLALGIVVLLVGFAMAWWIVALGVVIVFVFGLLWARDIAQEQGLAEEPAPAPAADGASAEPEPVAHEAASYTREKFLEATTLGLGAVIGALVTVPVLGFTVLPAFLNQGRKQHDLGPFSLYPEGQWQITTFPLKPEVGDVSRITVFIRYNGVVTHPETNKDEPSFTILSNHCVHLGCPVQPNGPPGGRSKYADITLLGTAPSSFGCPCHGGQYDTEGNRIAGPPVRALDRFQFSILNRRLLLGDAYSVAEVEGTGGTARIYKYNKSFPGVHVDGPESWLYPIQPPST